MLIEKKNLISPMSLRQRFYIGLTTELTKPLNKASLERFLVANSFRAKACEDSNKVPEKL